MQALHKRGDNGDDGDEGSGSHSGGSSGAGSKGRDSIRSDLAHQRILLGQLSILLLSRCFFLCIYSTYESYLKNLKRRVSLKVDDGSEDSGIVVSWTTYLVHGYL